MKLQPLKYLYEKRVFILLLLCYVVKFLTFSGAFPFFANTDERAHYDLVVKYSEQPFSRSDIRYHPRTSVNVVICQSDEYLRSQDISFNPYNPALISNRFDRPAEVLINELQTEHNHLHGSPPAYYMYQGMVFRLARWITSNGCWQLYMLRMANLPIMLITFFLAFLILSLLFDNPMLKLAVLALVMFMPQNIFYTINNDVFSPFVVCLMIWSLLKWYQKRNWTWSFVLGLAVGLSLLNKLTNFGLLFVYPLVLVMASLVKKISWKKLTHLFPYALGLGLTIGLFFTFNYIWYKDIFAVNGKITNLGWIVKSWSDFFDHPIFTASGFWYFVRGNLFSFLAG